MTTYTVTGSITAFTPDPPCYANGLTGTAWAYSFGSRESTINYNHIDKCYPYQTSLPLSYGTFSPGMCPGGYTTALSTLSRGLVTAACCPSSYDKVGWDAYCTSKRITSVSIDCVYPDTSGNGARVCAPGTMGPGNAVQFAIHVAYASSDLTRFPTGYTPGSVGDTGAVSAAALPVHVPGLVTSAPTSTPSGSVTGTSGVTSSTSSLTSSTSGSTSSAASQNNVGSSLSTGAKAGIGIGGAIVILAILLGFFLILRRRRKSTKESGNSAVPEDNGTYNDKEVVSADHAPPPLAHEPYYNELDGQSFPKHELAGFQEQNLHELPHDQAKNPIVQEVHPAPVVSRDLPPKDQSVPSPVTVEDFELKYLEDEERRIRERKEAILASRRS